VGLWGDFVPHHDQGIARCVRCLFGQRRLLLLIVGRR
jgi:hypothetical protein